MYVQIGDTTILQHTEWMCEYYGVKFNSQYLSESISYILQAVDNSFDETEDCLKLLYKYDDMGLFYSHDKHGWHLYISETNREDVDRMFVYKLINSMQQVELDSDRYRYYLNYATCGLSQIMQWANDNKRLYLIIPVVQCVLTIVDGLFTVSPYEEYYTHCLPPFKYLIKLS